MIKRRRALLAIGGMLLVGRCRKALAISGPRQSVQSDLRMAAHRLRNAVPFRTETHQMIDLCGELAIQCQRKSDVSPALAQATLDACERSITSFDSSRGKGLLQRHVDDFGQVVHRFIEVTAG